MPSNTQERNVNEMTRLDLNANSNESHGSRNSQSPSENNYFRLLLHNVSNNNNNNNNDNNQNEFHSSPSSSTSETINSEHKQRDHPHPTQNEPPTRQAAAAEATTINNIHGDNSDNKNNDNIKNSGSVRSKSDESERVQSPNGSEEGNGEKPKKRKRYHAKKACTHCRKAHTACDDERPCRRCKRKNLQCLDADMEVNYSSFSQPNPSSYSGGCDSHGPNFAVDSSFIHNKASGHANPNVGAWNSQTNQVFNQFIANSSGMDTSPSGLHNNNNNNNNHLKQEVQQLKDISKKQEMVLSLCVQQLNELQKVIGRQNELITQITYNATSSSQGKKAGPLSNVFAAALENPAVPIWFKAPPQLLQPISMWDKKKLTLMGCNEAFRDMIDYDVETLVNEFKILAFSPPRIGPYSEVLLFALLNSGAKYAELKSVWVMKSGEEIYFKMKFHIEDTFFWIEQEKCDTVNDEYRIDEYVHKKTYEIPFDPATNKKVAMNSNRVYAFLEVLNKVTESKKLQTVNPEYQNQSSHLMASLLTSICNAPPKQQSPTPSMQQSPTPSMQRTNSSPASLLQQQNNQQQTQYNYHVPTVSVPGTTPLSSPLPHLNVNQNPGDSSVHTNTTIPRYNAPLNQYPPQH